LFGDPAPSQLHHPLLRLSVSLYVALGWRPGVRRAVLLRSLTEFAVAYGKSSWWLFTSILCGNISESSREAVWRGPEFQNCSQFQSVVAHLHLLIGMRSQIDRSDLSQWNWGEWELFTTHVESNRFE
jgi:hypothetical protein